MKHTFLLLLLSLFIKYSFAQETRIVGPVEKKMADSVCNCLSKLDASKITTKAEAQSAITGCITNHMNLFMALATERKVDISDAEGLRKVGIDLGVDMMKNGCNGFAFVSAVLAKSGDDNEVATGTTNGTLKRIDDKGFNYFAVVDANNSEKSFIWLRQFPGSEKFTNGIGAYAGKKVKIKWDEIEVYLPSAKGYYKVKEIVDLAFE